MSTPIKVIFGAGSAGRLSVEELQKYLDVLLSHKVVDLDTASIYVSDH